MAIWLTFSICLLIMPVTQYFSGKVASQTGRGFDTLRASKNPVMYAFASRYSGLQLLRWLPFSVIVTIVALIVSIIFRNNMGALLVILMVTMFVPQMVALIAPVVATQRMLKHNFDAKGNPIGGILDGFDISQLPARVSGKTKLLITLTILFFIGVFTFSIVWGFATPFVTLRDSDMRISGMYGTTVRFADIEGVTLLEQSVRQIDVGTRIGGRATQTTLMGNFTAGLVLAHRASEGPTIRIDVRGDRPIFISRANAAETREIYQEISSALVIYQR